MNSSEPATETEKTATAEERKGAKTENHPDGKLIRQMLLSGWSPKRIEEWLKQKYFSDPSLWISERTIYSYRNNFIDPKMVLPTSYYEEKVKEIDIKIDTLRELYNQIEQQKQRVSLNLTIEDNSKVALPDTRKEMALLHEMIVNALQLEMQLGIRRQVPSKLEIDQRTLSLDLLLVRYLEGSKGKGELSVAGS